ncbi:MAG: hypothetical protein WC570_02540 [Patescibacteria group bacterium]
MLSNSSTKISERVQVVVSFSQQITPLLLVWQKRRIYIKKLNLVFEKKVGSRLYYYFHVSDAENNGYKLCLNTDNLEWILEEVSY